MNEVAVTVDTLAEQAYTLAMGQSLRPQDRAAVLKVVGKYEELRAERVQLTASFQAQVAKWVFQCFGPVVAMDKVERNHRFLEESLELAQALKCSKEEALMLVDYVYGRPEGDPPQEVGGVLVTLAALCQANGLNMQDAGDVELARVWTKVEQIREKQAGKPRNSPLPQHEITMESHVLRELVNELRDVAAQYHYHQSLRERLAGAVKKAIAIGKGKELMDADMHAELLRLREEAKAPDGFASWKDAAIHERTLRVRAQQTCGLTPGVK